MCVLCACAHACVRACVCVCVIANSSLLYHSGGCAIRYMIQVYSLRDDKQLCKKNRNPLQIFLQLLGAVCFCFCCLFTSIYWSKDGLRVYYFRISSPGYLHCFS